MLYRTPIAPFILGGSLQLGGSTLLELCLALFFSISLVSIYNIGLIWNKTIAITAAFILMIYPAYGILYHRPCSDPIFALGFILWCNYIIKTFYSPSIKKFIIHGFIIFLLILTRPSSQVFVSFVLFPFFALKLPTTKKLHFAITFFITCYTLLMLWSFNNYIRYDDFTISRGFKAAMPLYRLFITDKLIHPENGPYSHKLQKAIQEDLLLKEPYKSYGITIDEFFSSPKNSRMWSDLVTLSDRKWGWDDDYHNLFYISIEAIQKHPITYLKNTIAVYYNAFKKHYFLQAIEKRETNLKRDNKANKEYTRKGLPIPTKGEAIPRPYMWHSSSSPDNRMLPDPTSIELKISEEQQKRRQTLLNKVSNIPRLPVRNGNQKVQSIISIFLQFFPPMIYWVGFAIVGSFYFTSTQKRIYLTLLGLSLFLLGVTYSGIEGIAQYRVPFDPIFIIGGLFGFIRLMGFELKKSYQKSLERKELSF